MVLAGAALLVATTAACGGDAENDLEQEVVDHYASGVHASYLASQESAMAVDAAIEAFLDAPSEETLSAARAWR